MNPSPTSQPGARVIRFLATGFYSGLSPVAPGTCGTVACFLLVVFLSFFAPALLQTEILLPFSIAFVFLAIFVANRACHYQLFGPDINDPQPVVIDEFAGFFIAAITHGGSVFELFLAFVLFRVFDVTKPTPVRQLEGLPTGFGIVLDDCMAGLYANLTLWIVLSLL